MSTITSRPTVGMLVNTTRLGPTPCPSKCSGHGVCNQGACVCQVQWTGGECASANYPYVVTFGTVFTLLTLVSFVQLALTIYHDTQKSKTDRLREAFRFTVHKWLYFVAWLAAGSRAFSLIMQEGLSSGFALNVQSVYYPFLITLGSLLACLLGERYYLEVPSSETQSIKKSFLFYVGFNVALWVSFFLMIVLTAALPADEQAFVHRIFYLVFAIVQLLCVAFFLFYGVRMFYKVTGAFKTEDCRVNTTQLSLSRAGVFFQGIFQLSVVTLLVIDFSSHFFPPESRFFNRDLFNIVSRVTDIAVVIWFPCALWNCKRPETLWILNPRQVLDTTSGEYAALSAENQRSYGSTIRRVSANRAQQCSTDEFECWICYDVESRESGPLICPCDCKGGTAAVHHNCLKRWLLEQGELSQRKVPQCDICKKPYVLDRTRRFKFSCTTMQGLRSSLLICVIVAMPITVTFVIKHVPFHDLAKYTVIVVTAVLELVCLRLLGVTFDSICHRAMVAAVTILGPHPSSIQPPEDTTAEATSLPPSMPPAAATLDEMDKLQQQQHEHEPCSSPGTVLLLRRTPSPSIEDQQNSTYAVSAAANLPTSPPYPQSSIQQCSSSSDLIPSSRSQSVLFAVRPLA